jgi:hypothetical protein
VEVNNVLGTDAIQIDLGGNTTGWTFGYNPTICKWIVPVKHIVDDFYRCYLPVNRKGFGRVRACREEFDPIKRGFVSTCFKWVGEDQSLKCLGKGDPNCPLFVEEEGNVVDGPVVSPDPVVIEEIVP